ncbi:MAG: FAD-binding oxidoreductase [bacterium]
MDKLSHILQRKIEKEERYLFDESKMGGGVATRVFFPLNSSQVSEIVKHCSKNKVQLTVYGKGTGIAGAAVPFGGIVVSLEKMNKIEEVAFDKSSKKYFLKAEPSATLSEIRDKLYSSTHFYPVDSTEMGASIGGTVATNASGSLSYRFGATRKWVKSLEVVLMDGSIHKIERGEVFADESGVFNIFGKTFTIPDYTMPKCKNAAGFFAEKGMDIIDLFIGSEGLLGIVTKVEVWLRDKYPSVSVALFFEDENESFEFLPKIKNENSLTIDFIEYFDEGGLDMLREKMEREPLSLNLPKIDKSFSSLLFFDVEIKDGDIKNTLSKISTFDVKWENSWCAWEGIEKERIRIFRHALPEAVNEYIAEMKRVHPEIHKLGTDFAVSDEKADVLFEFYRSILKKSGLKYLYFGHIGDSHLHINFLPSNSRELEKGKEVYKEIAQKVIELKGTVSAEHGIGKLKHSYLEMMYGTEGIDSMREIKKVFDPLFLLNRGNMFSVEGKK